MTMAETQRQRRGHDFLPPEDERRCIPGERESEDTPLDEKVIHIHYFCAAGDWWIAELWPEDGQWMAFGYAQFAAMPEMAEWGLIPLDELEQVRTMAGLIIVERDLYWTPVPFWRTRADSSLATRISRLSDQAEAAALLDELQSAGSDHLSGSSTAQARAMILARFEATGTGISAGPPPDVPGTAAEPTVDQLQEWMSEGGCETPDGCWVEPDGRCEHGEPSWLLKLGMI
jgi:Protein of unknown function (DUF2958)